jgi:hypothetical protein
VNIAGALNPRPNARNALDLRSANQAYQPNLRENSRAARATGKICSFERRAAMTNETTNNEEAWKYAQKAMSWYGWGSPVGLGLLIVAIGAFVALLHVAGVIR